MSQEKRTRMPPMPVEQLLNIEQRIKRLGENGAATVIPGRLVPDAVARKIAKTMAYHSDIPDAEYVYELTQESIARTTARRIVKKARTLAAEMPKPPAVPASVQTPVATPSPAAPKPAAQTDAVSQISAKAPAAVSVANSGGGVMGEENAWPWPGADADKAAIEERLGRPLNRQDKFRNLRPELFETYEQSKYVRPMDRDNPDGRYRPTSNELQKYGTLWTLLGFNMVPEHLPMIIVEFIRSGLLEFYMHKYRGKPEVIDEILAERERMIAAGVEMKLPATKKKEDKYPGY